MVSSLPIIIGITVGVRSIIGLAVTGSLDTFIPCFVRTTPCFFIPRIKHTNRTETPPPTTRLAPLLFLVVYYEIVIRIVKLFVSSSSSHAIIIVVFNTTIIKIIIFIYFYFYWYSLIYSIKRGNLIRAKYL